MKKIQTTVYRLPCAGFAEKDGTFVNSARWLQWKNAALPLPGDCRLDQDILAQIFLKVRELYQKEGGKFPDPILQADLDLHRSQKPVALRGCEGNQRQGARRRQRSETSQSCRSRPASSCPASPGCETTARPLCGNWIYCGSWTEAGQSDAAARHRRSVGLGVYPNWAWSWPANRRVLYNRASCDLDGQALGSHRDGRSGGTRPHRRWVGNDVPDFKADSKPSDHMGPFIMNPEGVGRLFAPLAAFADGPFPEHYEPIESPIDNISAPATIEQSGGQEIQDTRRQVRHAGRRLQHRLHHLPADRALPLLDEEQPHERAARAGAVRRNSGGAGRRDGHPRRREGQGLQRPRRIHRQGDGHQAHQADDDRRQEDLPDRHPDSLGLSRHCGR